jgi:hypothetical protein
MPVLGWVDRPLCGSGDARYALCLGGRLWIASARSGVVNEVFFRDTDDLELISIARIAKSEVWGYRVAGDR